LLDVAPIFSSIEQFPAEIFAGKTDGFVGGFPCQPWSISDKRQGEFDEKGRNLWPQTIGLIRAIQPGWVFLENVSNLITHKYFGRILGDLAESGLDIEYESFTAAQAGAPHRRERVFILAFDPSFRQSDGGSMAHASSKRFQRFGYSGETESPQGAPNVFYRIGEFPPCPDDPAWGEVLRDFPELAPATCKHEPPARPQMSQPEPAVRGMADAGEVEDRVASLMALGNAVVPHQAELAFRTLASRI